MAQGGAADSNSSRPPLIEAILPPPPHYRRFGDPSASTEAPVTPEGGFSAYGQPQHVGLVLPQLTVRQLFKVDENGLIDTRAELLGLNKELLFSIIELATTLTERPSAYARSLETVGLILRNMHYLLNHLRQQQAQDTLEHLVREDCERKRAAIAELRDKLASLDGLPSMVSAPS